MAHGQAGAEIAVGHGPTLTCNHEAPIVAHTLRSMGHNNSHQNAGGHAAVAFDLAQITSPANHTRVAPDLPAPTLIAAGKMHVAQPWAVRRLTPTECERLQAFPDDYTRIPYRGKPADRCPDGPRYKALGNSMAVNVMAWIGERIALVDAMEAAA